MSEKKILEKFIKAGAVLKGHFKLSSGLHSDTYIQCSKITHNAKINNELCVYLVDKILKKISDQKIDLVISPAMGGVLVGYEISRILGVENIFCERVGGEFQLRRGFQIPEKSNILIVEDVITTGKSSLEVLELISNYDVNIVAEASLIDRSDSDLDIEKKLSIPVISLLKVEAETFSPNNIPEHLKNLDAIKPGSRFISNS
jgi:orotate phosphoribosyltransferase|tara:strand:- start:5167 stop:5772 length:606 start_codon:yes stop_codon:yes gene_type:complete